jgi:nitrate/nitrite-specific signal transduction histidine kinase
MRTHELDSRHSRAIVQEIGEQLRASFKEERELPANFRKQIERLRQSEREALANLARSSRGDKS